VFDPSAVDGSPLRDYQRQNVLYLGKAVRIVKAALAKPQALSIVGDEARCTDAQLLAVFVSAPVSPDVAHGYFAPLQVNPDLHIDLDEESLDFRIKSLQSDDGQHPPKVQKPKADPLVATWHLCACLDNALQSSVGIGLMHFAAKGRTCEERASLHVWHHRFVTWVVFDM
jgi:hypothetical protein